MTDNKNIMAEEPKIENLTTQEVETDNRTRISKIASLVGEYGRNTNSKIQHVQQDLAEIRANFFTSVGKVK